MSKMAMKSNAAICNVSPRKLTTLRLAGSEREMEGVMRISMCGSIIIGTSFFAHESYLPLLNATHSTKSNNTEQTAIYPSIVDCSMHIQATLKLIQNCWMS